MTAKPVPSAGGTAAGLIVMLFLVGIVVYSCSAGGNDSGNDDSSNDEIGAEVMCEQFVTERLKAPSTAEFPGADSVVVTGDDQYKVTASVDSENGFGAMIRTDYVCLINDNGDETWTLVSLDMG